MEATGDMLENKPILKSNENDVGERSCDLINGLTSKPKLYIQSALNIDLILWHTQLIVCAENIKSWVFPFTFQAYILPHTLNCMCVSLFLNSYLNFRAVLVLPKTAGSVQTHKSMSFI